MSQQTILITIFILIISATAYFLLQDISSQIALESDPRIHELETRLSELRSLKNISFDTAVFQDTFFRSLALPVIAPPPDIKIGRLNPFIPF